MPPPPAPPAPALWPEPIRSPVPAAPCPLALVEDDAAVRELLARYLGAQPEFACVHVAASAEELLAWLPDAVLSPRLILLDIQLPGLSGLQALPQLRRLAPQADIVMQTIFDDAARIFEALRLGASGYLLKGIPLPTLKAALLEVAQGGASLSGPVARQVLHYFQPRPLAPPTQVLSAREREVVQGIVDGLSEKQLAERLLLTPHTIHTHLKRIYRKLHVSSRAELLGQALRPPA